MAGEVFIARQDTLEEVKTAIGDLAGGGTDVLTLLSELKTLIQTSGGGGVKKVQRGTATAAGTITIEAVNVDKTVVYSVSKGSDGYVAATGKLTTASKSMSYTSAYAYNSGNTSSQAPRDYKTGTSSLTATIPALTGTLSGGTTDLTVKEYSAVLTDSTTLTCDGPCEWQVVEYM